MTTDEPSAIHNGEIWLKSQCLVQEQHLARNIYECLQQHNYQNVNAVSDTRSVWERGSQKIVVSLVDDLWDCSSNRSFDTPYLFDPNTTVITDNFLNCPSVYRLYQVPKSFYGIYSYKPEDLNWEPERDYTFAVNRLDYKRMEVLLHLHRLVGLNDGYVNFNCRIKDDVNASPEQRRQGFIDQAVEHSASIHDRNTFMELAKTMPMKNHTADHDELYTRSWLNIIVETYSSDNVISTSEKIFRCLVTPTPWIAYCGRYTIAKLRELGFDVMDDIVNHNYDHLLEANHKMPNFAITARETVAQLKTKDWDQVKSRAQSAANHNQELLSDLSTKWEKDQYNWLMQLNQDLR